MHLYVRNVNEAFKRLVTMFAYPRHSVFEFAETDTRNGSVIRAINPVTITYQEPCQRVLFNESRDANPFFHLYESLWMLAGRNDVAPLKYYVSTFGQFSDDGVILNGAYGYRWRHACAGTDLDGVRRYKRSTGGTFRVAKKVDQLNLIIDHLKSKPESRRAVLHMSNVEDDTMKMDTTKDQCCNLSCVFEIVSEIAKEARGERSEAETPVKRYLNMSVFNRSNDLVWGCLGANVVHFSMLQEYVACCLGVEVGKYHQISTNLHAYTDPSKWKPYDWIQNNRDYYQDEVYKPLFSRNVFPLVKDPETFNREVQDFVERHQQDSFAADYHEPFLEEVAQPMCIAFHHHKRRDYDRALSTIQNVKAIDWRIAGRHWILKRKNNWEKKQ